MMPTVELTPDEVVVRGKTIYEQQIRAQVEAGNIGKLMLVDVTTGHWEIGEDRIASARKLRALNPDAVMYGLRIGYPAAEKMGAWPRTSRKPLDTA